MLAGTRGGLTRIRILNLLLEKPHNACQLAARLGLDYKAIQHHMRVLEKNNLVARQGEKYGVLYFISDYLEVNLDVFEEIRAKMAAAVAGDIHHAA